MKNLINNKVEVAKVSEMIILEKIKLHEIYLLELIGVNVILLWLIS